MSAVSSARRKKADPLSKKVPENPKYKHVKATVDTGASITKYMQRIDEIKQNYKLRKDEIFKRMKITTFVQLVEQVYMAHEDNFELATPPDTERDSSSPDEEIQKVQASGSPVPSIALTDGDFGDQETDTSRSTLHSVAHGVGELDLNKPEEAAEQRMSQVCPYLLLDVRDPDEYQTGHIISAQSYPKAILSRSVNYETKDMLAYKNIPGRIIVLYDEDERVAPNAATTLVQRGYDNLFMLSGGLKLVRKVIPEGLVTSAGVSECGSFSADAINCLEFHLDQALQDHSIGKKDPRRLSKASTASSRMSSRATVRSNTSDNFNGRAPFR